MTDTPQPTVKRRRWLRFSLRTLLLLVTAAAVWMGITMKNIRDRREAIRAIDDLGGTYGVRRVGPKWLWSLVGDEKSFYDARRISLGPSNEGYNPNHPVTDEDLGRVVAHFKAFSNVSTLDLWDPGITNGGLQFISGLVQLKNLDLTGTSITPEAVEELRKALPSTKVTGP